MLAVIMTRSRAKKGTVHIISIPSSQLAACLVLIILLLAVPVEYTSVPFPVKALKIILHELQQSGKVNVSKTPEPGATPGEEAMSDDEVSSHRCAF